jgi:hypothetical protein
MRNQRLPSIVTQTRTTLTQSVTTDTPVSLAVVSAVSELKRIDPLELDAPLYDVVDPDALDDLFGETIGGRRNTYCRVQFEFDGCEVVIERTYDPVVTVCEVE